MDYKNLENVPATELAIGDQIYTHGLVFQVKEIVVSGDIHANICDCLTPDADSQMPKQWRENWNQQGNCLAMVPRLINKIAA